MTARLPRVLPAFSLLALAFALPAQATGLAPTTQAPSSRAAFLDSGAPTLAPFAHVVFCQALPAECRTDGQGPRAVSANGETLRALRQVNLKVNRAIRPQADAPGPMGDRWSLSPAKGDCEDYAITKRHLLAEAGFPVSALRLVVGTRPDGQGHAILLVRTDDGDLVLDNLTDRIVELDESRMRPLKVQSGADPRRWTEVPAQALAFNQ